MTTEIYIYGCTSCGVNAAYIRRVLSSVKDIKVYNTKSNKLKLQDHIEYLKSSGISVNEYHSIVVEGRGEIITLLKEWR